MAKYFGTDGIRGKAELFSRAFLEKIILGLRVKGKKVLIGGDTRESTERILKDLGEILVKAEAEKVGTVGVLSTPAINYVFYQMGFDFAIDVTASHNPYTDNGIKIFERGERFGVKLGEEARERIERALEGGLSDGGSEEGGLEARLEDLSQEAKELYKKHLEEKIGEVSFRGLKIGLDFANGATGVLGDEIFKKHGAETVVINRDFRFGRKINDNAGSTHIEGLRKLVLEEKLDFGAAFDGDGDRVLFVDEDGEIVDGDEILVILAEELGLKKIVATIMANQGLIEYGKENGVEILTTDVGDQNVFKEMIDKGVEIGGEQSGHVILPREAMGDGVLVALTITKIISKSGRGLGELKRKMKKFPQFMINIPATREEKEYFKKINGGVKIINGFRERLEETRGRVLVRPSGTEELIRITVWGESLEKITEIGEELAEKLKEEIKNGRD